MGYIQKGSGSVVRAMAKNKATGLAHSNSMALQTDPKDGVVVTGKDKSKSAEQARLDRVAKRKQEMADAKMKRDIAMANKKEEFKFKLEEKKAARAGELQRQQQELKKKRGQISQEAEDTSTSYSPANQLDPKDGTNSTQMKNLPIGSKARYDEYNKRNWMHDETSLTPTDKGMRQTDLRKTSNFKNISDRNRVPVDKKEYNKRKKSGASVTDLFTQYSSQIPSAEKIQLPKNMGFSGVQQRINVFNK